jgi:putative ABC transport system permease protein
MRAIWQTTVQGVAARKVRLALTALSIVLGVAFVAGVYVLTDTLRRSFDIAFAQTGVGIDLVVRDEGAFAGDGQGRDRPRLPETALETVRATPGVDKADGNVVGFARFVDQDGDPVSSAGAPTVGISWSTTPGVGPLRIADGRPPERDGEVAMDEATAGRLGYRVGDEVGLLLIGPKEQYRIVGIFRFGERTDLGPLTFAAFDLRTAQREFGDDGFDAINVVTEPGADDRDVARTLREQLGDVEVLRSTEVVAETAEPVEETLGFLNAALLGFAGIGLLVGGFIIFNTFTILVSQRTRELGLLRAVGGSRAQIIGSVLAEAVIVGLAGSLVGLGLGIGLARLLLDVLPGFGLTVPDTGLVVDVRTIVASFVIGVGVTTAAALHPAFRAARVAPVAAIGDAQPRDVGATPLVRRTVAGALVAMAGLAISFYGIEGGLGEERAVAVAFLGVFVVFLGVVAMGPVLARPLARLLGRPLPTTLGVTGTLARGNASRNPRRTSSTAAALVIGLGLVSLVAIFTASAKASLRTGIDDGLRADTVTTGQGSSMSPEAGGIVRDLPQSRDVVTIRFGEVRIEGREEHLAGVTPTGLDRVVHLDVVDGHFDGTLAEDEILVSQREADYYGLRVGEPMKVAFPLDDSPGRLTVVAIYDNQSFLGDWSIRFMINQDRFDAGFQPPHRDWYILANAAEPTKAGTASLIAAAASALAEPFPNADVRSQAGYKDAQESDLDTFLNVFVALLLLSEVIALLGIVNTLLLSVYERTREIGLLRAVGMSRLQVRRMVRGESVVIALIGCVLGLLIGLLWAWAVVSALSGQGIDSIAIPPGDLLLFVVVSAIAGFVAALIPAWRASRLDVLEAIAHE